MFIFCVCVCVYREKMHVFESFDLYMIIFILKILLESI